MKNKLRLAFKTKLPGYDPVLIVDVVGEIDPTDPGGVSLANVSFINEHGAEVHLGKGLMRNQQDQLEAAVILIAFTPGPWDGISDVREL